MTLVFCKSNRKHQDWFDDTDKKAKALLEERNNARVKKQDKSDWYSTKSTAVQKGNEVLKVGGKGWRIAADSRKKRHESFLQWYGPQRRGTTQLTDLDGETIIQEKAEILHRFTNYFDKLLNITGEVPALCLGRHYTETKHCISCWKAWIQGSVGRDQHNKQR